MNAAGQKCEHMWSTHTTISTCSNAQIGATHTHTHTCQQRSQTPTPTKMLTLTEISSFVCCSAIMFSLDKDSVIEEELLQKRSGYHPTILSLLVITSSLVIITSSCVITSLLALVLLFVLVFLLYHVLQLCGLCHQIISLLPTSIVTIPQDISGYLIKLPPYM